MHNKQVYRKHSDEFRDIIDRFPKKNNNRLLILLIIVVLLIFIFGWFIKSPDIIFAEIRVTAEKPPVLLVARTSGNIKLKKNQSGQKVLKGEYIAILRNSANEDHIKDLKSKISKFSFDSIPQFNDYSFALNYNLGELQNNYFDFIKTIYQLNQLQGNNKYNIEINSLQKQIKEVKNSINKRNEIVELKDTKINISKENVKIDSILSSKGAIVHYEYEKSKKNLLRELEDKSQEENNIIQNKLNIVKLKDKISSLSIEKKETLESLNVSLLTNYHNLTSAIELWEQNYAFIAPFNGTLEHLKFITNDLFINQGETVFSVLPLDNKIIGQALMPSDGAGKVKKGQFVNIKLDSYPYQEFGIINGVVNNISLMPLENVYLVNIDLPNSLISDNGISLNFSKEMSGQAEIITEKRRLLSRMFEKIKHAFDQKRKDNIISTKENPDDNKQIQP